jgi:hypothetical protein
MAPAVGFEPTTNRLTADRSTTELRWILLREKLTDSAAFLVKGLEFETVAAKTQAAFVFKFQYSAFFSTIGLAASALSPTNLSCHSLARL